MKLRFLVLSVLAIVILSIGGLASAQDMPFDECLGMDSADCDVFLSASANGAGDAESFSIELNFNVLATGIPDEASGGTIEIEALVSGAVDVIMGDDLLPNASGEVTLSASQGGVPMLPEMTIGFALVDGIAYWQDPFTSEWQGTSALDAMSDPSLTGGLPIGDLSDPEALTSMMPDADTIAALGEILTLPGFLSFVRSGDDFTLTVDATALGLLGTPEYEETTNAIIATLSELDEGAASMGMLLPMIPMVLSEGLIVVSEHVDTGRNIVDNIALDVDFTIDPSMLTGEAGDPIVLTVDMAIGIDNFDNVGEIVAPQGATMTSG